MQIKFEETLYNILVGKLWHFKRKSILKYTLAALMFSVALNQLQVNENTLKYFIFSWITILGTALISMIFSAYLRSKKGPNYKILDFREDSIKIIENQTIHLEWSEIQIVENKKHIFLRSLHNKYYYYWIKKDKINNEDLPELMTLFAKKGFLSD